MVTTRRNLLRTIGRLGLVALPLGLVSCSTQSLIRALTLVADAADVVLPVVLTAVGVPPPVTALIMGYVSAVAQGVSQAGTLVASGPLTPQLAAQIIAIFAMVLKPVLPPGLPAVVVGVIDDLANKLASFLGQLVVHQPPPSPVGPKVLGPPIEIKLHGRDKKAIQASVDKCNRVVERIRAAGY